MKEKTFFKHWHISVVVLLIFVISLVSWIKFAMTMKRIVSAINPESKTETTNSFEIKNNVDAENKDEKDLATKISKICNSLDDTLTKVDSQWIVYNDASLSKVDSLASYLVLGEISSVQVITCSDKWLFYSSKTDGNPIEDFEGTNGFSQQEMDLICQSALIAQKEIENRGIKFEILVAPNKENIYSEYMPKKYKHAQKSRTDLLIDYLTIKGVNIVSPKKELLDNHIDKQLYYWYDTHWNQLGAYIGVKKVLLQWNIIMPELQAESVKTKELFGNYHYCAVDDLAQMAGLKAFFRDEIEYEVVGTIPLDWDLFQAEQDSGEISHFHNKTASISAKMFLVGDSFRSAMVPALCEQFSDVYVIHRASYSKDMLDYVQPDYMLVEYVERYSNDMKVIDSLVK